MRSREDGREIGKGKAAGNGRMVGRSGSRTRMSLGIGGGRRGGSGERTRRWS